MGNAIPLTRMGDHSGHSLQEVRVEQPRAAYRADVDGLRAFAVVAVVLFHAFPTMLPGGFVGVDVFFVISGYLISTILFREIDSGTYSYARFMGRRIRRIFPALGTVLAATAAGGWLLLNKKELLELASQFVAGSLFGANILFWKQQNYFDTASEFKPLLHLWSLGVEEQYYLLYPPLLWLIARLRVKRLPVLGVVFLGSLACSIALTSTESGFAFFMLPCRFWELLCGAFVAAWLSRSGRSDTETGLNTTLIRSCISLVGIAWIAAAIFLTTRDEFPGYLALLPTLGASLFILAGPTAFLNRTLFSLRPVVAIGLISYPLYLWHWPIISFEHILAGGVPAIGAVTFALALALGLSIITYLAIEKPLRHLPTARTYLFLAPIAPVMAALGAIAIAADGFPTRAAALGEVVVNQGHVDHDFLEQYVDKKYPECEPPALREHALKSGAGTMRCHQSRAGDDYDLVLLGDSHAEHLFAGLAALLPEKNVVYAINYGKPTSDNAHAKYLYDYLLNRKNTKQVTVIMTAYWVQDTGSPAETKGLEETARLLSKAGYRVFTSDDVPAFPFKGSHCQIQRRFNLSPAYCYEQSPAMTFARKNAQSRAMRLANATGIQVLHTFDFFKEDDAYFMGKDGFVLYRDNNHLNLEGSLFVANQLKATGQLKLLGGD